MIRIKPQNAMVLALWIVPYLAIYGQSLSPTVLANASGDGKAGGIWLQWTLGETAIRAIHTDDHIYTEGFHQPTLIIKEDIINQNNISIRVAPNPTVASIHVDILSHFDADIVLDLKDIKGSHLMHSNMKSETHSIQLDIQSFSAGIYFLQVRNINGSFFKTFKVIKL